MSEFPDLTREMLIKKAELLFPNEDIAHILSILDGYGHDSYHWAPNQVKMAILRLCNGRLERLKVYVEVACSDFRDVLLLAEWPCQFRAEMAKDSTVPLPEDPETFDREQYQAWLDADTDLVRFFVCENCCGVGILPVFPETPDKNEAIRLPDWHVCLECHGTGEMPQLSPE